MKSQREGERNKPHFLVFFKTYHETLWDSEAYYLI